METAHRLSRESGSPQPANIDSSSRGNDGKGPTRFSHILYRKNCPCYLYEMRGSSQVYMRSTIRLMTITIRATVNTVAVITGRSLT